MQFPITTAAWRRFKLLMAELIVLSLGKGEHTHGYNAGVLEAADGIRDFRERYYPRSRQ